MRSARRSRFGAEIAVALLIVAAWACSSEEQRADSTGVAQDPSARTFAMYGCDSVGEGFPVIGLLSGAERWIEVVEAHDPLLTALESDDGTIEVALGVRSLARDAAGRLERGEIEVEKVPLFRSMQPGLAWALSQGRSGYVALANNGVNDFALVALIEDDDGTMHFVGGCAAQTLQDPLRQRLGTDLDVALRQLIGETNAQRIESALGGTPTESR